jgi:phosphatidylserine/phosphatidylglycerophosphate/cardiolipin synthase-like enzyme
MMYRFCLAIILPCLLFISSCHSNTSESDSLPQDKYVQVYFNHRQTGKHTYSDPYRHIKRQGDNLEAVMIQEIAQAQSTIDVAVQELRLPEIAKALIKSHRSGVKVRVIVDNKYSRPLSELDSREIGKLNQRDRKSYEEFVRLVDTNQDGNLSQQEIDRGDALIMLRNSSVPIIDDTADRSKGSGLMHHKFVVIDDRTVVTGSANFTLSGIHGDFSNPETRGNANHLLVIRNPQLARIFTEEFDYMWEDKLFGLAKPKRSSQTVVWENTETTVYFSPTSPTQGWNASGNGLIGQAIADSTSSLDLALFVFSEQKLADILQKKSQKGVTIRAVFDPEFAFLYYSEALDMLGVALSNRCQYESQNNPWSKPINSVGIPQLATGDKLHHKFTLIDNQKIITGSQNWSTAANNTNDETVLIIDNMTVANHFKQEFEYLYNSSKKGIPEFISHRIQVQLQKCS